MQIFHLLETGEASPAAITPLLYGRCTATVQDNGKLLCDNHLLRLDTDNPPEPGEKLMIWCEHDYFCCRVSEYESAYRH